MLRPAPRSASIGSVRVANHAGAAPKTMPVSEREAERERQHQRRRTRVDRQERRPREGEREQQPRRADRDDQSGDAAGDREQDALDERLRHDLPARGADRQPQRGLPAPRHGAREQQVRDVRAGDEQHQPAHAEEDLQAASVLFLHDADAGAGRHHRDHLLRQRSG